MTEVKHSRSPKARSLGQFLTFAAIGIANTAVYYAVYASTNHWIPYLVAHVLGWSVSITGSFLLNSYITCRTRPTWGPSSAIRCPAR